MHFLVSASFPGGAAPCSDVAFQPNNGSRILIDFIVVGGGITGLACALALRRVRHRVIVLEKVVEEQVSQVCVHPLLADSLPTHSHSWPVAVVAYRQMHPRSCSSGVLKTLYVNSWFPPSGWR